MSTGRTVALVRSTCRGRIVNTHSYCYWSHSQTSQDVKGGTVLECIDHELAAGEMYTSMQ